MGDHLPHEDPVRFTGSVRQRPAASAGSTETPEGSAEALDFTYSSRVDRQIEEARRQPSQSKTLVKDAWQLIRPDYFLKHLDCTSLKVVVRTWLQLWLGDWLTVISKTGNWLGPTSFLLNAATVISCPGGMSYSESIFQNILNLLFTVVGWFFAVVAQLISWRLRGSHTRQEFEQYVVENGICVAGDLECFLKWFHNGQFLTTKTTAVMLFGLITCVTAMGILQCKYPKFLTVPWIYGMVSVTVNSVYTNFSPYFEPWYAMRMILVPFAMSFALSVVSCLTIFPTTSSFKVQNVLAGVAKGAAAVTAKMLAQQKIGPSQSEFQASLDTLAGAQAQTAKFPALDVDTLMARLEVSYTRLDTGDLGEVRGRLRGVLHIIDSFQFFYMGLKDRKDTIVDGTRRRSSIASEKGSRRANGELRKRSKFNNWNWDADPSHYIGLADIDDLFFLITARYRPLVEAVTDTLSECSSWLAAANTFRTSTLVSPEQRRKAEQHQEEQSEALAAAVAKMKSYSQSVLKGQDWIDELVAADSPHRRHHYAYTLSQDAFYGFICQQYFLRVNKLADYCLGLDKSQPTPRWTTYFHSPRAQTMSLDNTESNFFSAPSSGPARNPDCLPPNTTLQQWGSQLLKAKRLLGDPNFLFSLKRAVFLATTLVLYMCRPTLKLAFGYKLIWVAMLGTMNVFQQAADGVYGLFVKFVFTITGCLVGMTGWYICAGNGPGNAFGYIAVVVFVDAFLAFHRHFSGHKVPMGSLAQGLTIVLIIGTSWVNNRRPTPGTELKWGYHLTWVRFVCVTLGIFLGFLATLFPRPVTNKKAIRRIISKCLRHLGNAQTAVLNFSFRRADDATVSMNPLQDSILGEVRQVFTSLTVANNLKRFVQYEPPLGGQWPAARYDLLLTLERQMANLYYLAYALIDNVAASDAVPGILYRMGWSSPRIVSGLYAVLYMCGPAIVSGEPLPALAPGHLTEQHQNLLNKLLNGKDAAQFQNIVEARYLHKDGRAELVAIMISAFLYERIDGTMVLVKGLVGDCWRLWGLEAFSERANLAARREYTS